MRDTVFDQVIFSVAIVYSRSLFEEVKVSDQQLLISVFATILAIAAAAMQRKWDIQTKFLQEKDKTHSQLWRTIVSQWFKIAQMISTFVAINSLVFLVDQMIRNTERFYYEAILFPMITILFGIAAVTIFDQHFFK